MEVIKHFFTRMQRAYSPLKKLENLLGATTAIYNTVKVPPQSGRCGCLAADGRFYIQSWETILAIIGKLQNVSIVDVSMNKIAL